MRITRKPKDTSIYNGLQKKTLDNMTKVADVLDNYYLQASLIRHLANAISGSKHYTTQKKYKSKALFKDIPLEYGHNPAIAEILKYLNSDVYSVRYSYLGGRTPKTSKVSPILWNLPKEDQWYSGGYYDYDDLTRYKAERVSMYITPKRKSGLVLTNLTSINTPATTTYAIASEAVALLRDLSAYAAIHRKD